MPTPFAIQGLFTSPSMGSSDGQQGESNTATNDNNHQDDNNNNDQEGLEVSFEETKQIEAMEAEIATAVATDPALQSVVAPLSNKRRPSRFSTCVEMQKAKNKYTSMRLMSVTQGTGKAGIDVDVVSGAKPGEEKDAEEATPTPELEEKEKTAMEQRLERVVKKQVTHMRYKVPVQVNMRNLTFQAKVFAADAKIKTVYNASFLYALGQFCKRLMSGTKADPPETKIILNDINLCLKPGHAYLVLGSPGSGKSSLLKAIAGRLRHQVANHSKKKGDDAPLSLKGSVAYNGKTLDDEDSVKHLFIENAVAYIDQLDRHAPRLTVEETFEFAFQCKTGGIPAVAIMAKADGSDPKMEENIPALMATHLRLEVLGLAHVKDTFVGDDNVRGVSGGQRRRVTVGEMIMEKTPLLCGDEISTGLDAASTFDMVDLLTYYGRLQNACQVVALLQPSPETVALFDEVIVLAEGKIMYSGPLEDVQVYFEDLGYQPPDTMDVADFLQVLSTPDAAALWKAPPDLHEERSTAYSVDELAELFKKSKQYQKILQDLDAPVEHAWDAKPGESGSAGSHLNQLPFIHQKYANSFPRAVWLNLKRSLTLWIRDRRVLIANFAKNAIMGVSVGGVFYQTEDVVSILGVLFQSMLFIMLGASTAAPALVDDRVIFRKHYEANFFSAYPFVIGRTLSQLPQTLSDVLVFGTILYFMVGLHLSVVSYVVFIAILFTFSVLINQIMACFAAVSQTKDTVQVICAVILLFCILFGGFIVPPNVIPDYYIWIYWWNPFAWAYRALLVLEFQSSDWDDGDKILESSGFTLSNGDPFEMVWVGYYFAYMAGHYLLCVFITAYGLGRVAASAGGKASSSEDPSSDGSTSEEEETTHIPFVPATLTFENMCYDVQASTGKDQLRLLSNVNGVLESGRMVALMGSSGAGKTTLMDVVAMRKSSGTVTGEVMINGFPQERISFRRASGYVEQFDVQSPELTVRETILYSALLRLDNDVVKTEGEKVAFVTYLMKTLELLPFADSLVGTSESGGLSFEQKKRLSIAVELAASPSIIFLDEPTSGLDARSALMVVKLLRKIATEGRTICATIHQPSSAVFEMFDDLLLLKRGGQVVYFGELGEQSKSLTRYFEERGARPIEIGENPANWVLTVMTSDSHDYAAEYIESEKYKKVKEQLLTMKTNPDPSKKISYENPHAAPKGTRYGLTSKRLRTIYWRSPNYNLSRIMVSVVIAVIMASVLVRDRFRDRFSETQMRAQFAVVFLSFIIVGIMSIFSVLPVMLSIRDMFYRHRQSGMIGSGSLAWALGSAEKGFIVSSSFIFCLVFLGISYGTTKMFKEMVTFWGFFTFNSALYSYFGQAFVCFFEPMATAQILASVFIGLNNFFSGLIVRPQFMTGLFAITYWITPGHYVYEGMITALFEDDNRTVVADEGTDFWNYLDCSNTTAAGDECTGTVGEFMFAFYGGKFVRAHIGQNLLILGGYLVVARAMTFVALNYINFSGT